MTTLPDYFRVIRGFEADLEERFQVFQSRRVYSMRALGNMAPDVFPFYLAEGWVKPEPSRKRAA